MYKIDYHKQMYYKDNKCFNVFKINAIQILSATAGFESVSTQYNVRVVRG